LDFVLVLEVAVLFAGTDRPAHTLLIALDPPAVQNTHVEAAVAGHLHPARPGSLERTARIIEPDIDALNHVSRNVDVVIFEKNHAAAKLGTPRDMQYLRD